jgi:hypothetical protein
VQASNKLQAEASQLEEQNMALRYLFICSVSLCLTTSGMYE